MLAKMEFVRFFVQKTLLGSPTLCSPMEFVFFWCCGLLTPAQHSTAVGCSRLLHAGKGLTSGNRETPLNMTLDQYKNAWVVQLK
jgi:hypothetical protein